MQYILKLRGVFIILLLFTAIVAEGQFVPAEVIPTKEKTIIDGKVYFIHTVQKGQTFFSICRAYGVSQDEVLKENPGVIPETLKEGTSLRIPAGDEAGKAPAADLSRFYEHRVRRRQTVYSISRRYDVTEEMIYLHNPWAREGIKVDQILLIPKTGSGEAGPLIVSDDEQTETEEPSVTETLNVPCSAPEGATYDVALLLPFFTDYFRMLQSGNVLSENTPVVQGQIPALSREFAEFYEGFLLAADSMRRGGMSFNLHVYDTDRDNSKISGIQKAVVSESPDLIIGPVYTEQLNSISRVSQDLNVNLVSPLSTNTSLTASNVRLFQVTPSKDYEAAALAAYLSRFNQGRFILVRDSISLDDSWRFKNKMLAALENQTAGASRLTEVTLNDIVNNNIGSILAKDQPNYVVVFSESEPDVGELVTRLYMESSNYNIVLVGQPVWQIWKTLELSFLHKLQLTLFSPFHVDYTKPEIQSFLKKCREIYGFEPYEISRSGYNFCMLGYDMGLYFLTALKDYGRDFQNCIENHRTATLLSDYSFQGGVDKGYINNYISFIRYNQDFTIENIKIQLP